MTVDVEIDSRIAKCQKILGTDPNSQIFAALADAHRKKGELDKAFQVCQTGLRVHPEYGAAHVVMAKINLDRGLYDWAEAEVEKARRHDGNNRNIELLLAEIYIYKGDFQAAVQLLRKLSLADPGNHNVQRLLDIAEKIPREQEKRVGAPVSSSVARAPRTIEAVPAPPAEPVLLTPRDLLREALKLEHVIGALYMNEEGLVMESEWRAEMDPIVCGAAMAEVKKFLNQELMKASFGQVGTVLVETAVTVFYLVQAAGGIFLILGEAALNLGTLRMKMADLTERVTAT
jgi:predicted regulator of Ras-like GTPase activity (Roadblock/LC7/MglB family)